MRLQSSQQNRKHKTINTASYHIVIQSTSFMYYNMAWKGGSFTFPFYPLWIVSICFTQTPPTHFIKIKWVKDLSFCHTKRRKKRDDFLLPKSSLFFLKPWMNKQNTRDFLFVYPLKICEQYGFIQSCSYKSKASNRPWTIQQKVLLQSFPKNGYKHSTLLFSSYSPII